jgi:hypothetical protein
LKLIIKQLSLPISIEELSFSGSTFWVFLVFFRGCGAFLPTAFSVDANQESSYSNGYQNSKDDT